MKRMMNCFRRIGICLSAAMLLPVPLEVFADNTIQQTQSGYSEDGVWLYNDYGEGIVSVMCQDETLVNAVVPETIDGRTVTMIEVDCFKINKDVLETVTLPKTITEIEDWSFQNCTKLQSVNLPNGLTDIKWQAFYGCSSLTEMNIPASVTNIEEFVFEGCASMERINVSDGNKNYVDIDGVLFNYDMTTLMYYPSAKTDKTFDLPESCTKIEDWAFIGNSYLEEIDISGITELGEDAFYYCTALKSIAVPEGISALEGAVFGGCTSLESVTLPSTLDSIGDSCFYSCTALKEITIPGRVDAIGSYAFFNCASLKTITINDAVKTIGDYALGYYQDAETEEYARFPDFVVDTDNDTAAHRYCVVNDIKSTGGVTQSSVFIVVVIVIIVLVIAATIAIIIIQHQIKKRYELR